MNMMVCDDERAPNEQGRGALGGQERVEWSREHYVAMRGRRNWIESSRLKPCLKF